MSASYTAFKCSCPKNTAYAIKNIRTLWSFTKILHPNFPEPYRVYTCTGTSPAICIEPLWNLTRYLHRTSPEPQQVSPPEPSGTLRNLARNLVLKLHRIAPEFFWAKDPIATFFCWGKRIHINPYQCFSHKSRNVISILCYVRFYHTDLYHIITNQAMSFHIIPLLAIYHVISIHIITNHAMSFHIIQFQIIVIISYHSESFHVMSLQITPYQPISYHILP
jgi:hypothetical protein